MIESDAALSRLNTRRRKRSLANRRYGAATHKRLRKRLEPVVAAGLARCARCHQLIEPGEPWDLGHDDRFPSLHSGPEHLVCNRGAPHRNKTSRVW